MGKAVILNFPTHGCINALLATVGELVKRGERVVYYCTEEFRDKIERTGAEFRPYRGRLNQFSIKDYDIYKLLKFQLAMTVDKLAHNLDEIREENPDYIIHDSLCVWGKQIAAILKLPAVNLMHSFPIVDPSELVAFDNASVLLKVGLYKLKDRFSKNSPKKTLKKKYHVDLSLGDTFINQEGLNIVYTSRPIKPAIDQAKKNFHFVGPSLFFKDEPSDFPFDRIKGRNVVYISLGTMHNNNPRFYKTSLDAFAGKDLNVVMSIGYEVNPQKFADAPQNFIIRPSVPQQKLLEKVNVFITHGGMNSVNEAICSGVPMLVFPHQFEQTLIGRRVAEMGIGKLSKIKSCTPENLYENVNALISEPSYRNQAQKYKAMFVADEKSSHIKAADKILDYVRQGDRRN